MDNDLELITDKQIEESERIRKFMRELMPKQVRGYYADGGNICGYYTIAHPTPFY